MVLNKCACTQCYFVYRFFWLYNESCGQSDSLLAAKSLQPRAAKAMRRRFYHEEHKWARSLADEDLPRRAQGPRRSTKPCGGLFCEEGLGIRGFPAAGSWMLYDFIHEGPRRPCGGGFTTKNTNGHEVLRMKIYHEGPKGHEEARSPAVEYDTKIISAMP